MKTLFIMMYRDCLSIPHGTHARGGHTAARRRIGVMPLTVYRIERWGGGLGGRSYGRTMPSASLQRAIASIRPASQIGGEMFTVEKIENVPNPVIPQWRVYDQERALTLSVRILKSHNRSWLLYAERWANGKWTLLERLGETSSQALAYCDAGAFLERMYQNTGAKRPRRNTKRP